MDLKENYKRFFGEINQPKAEPITKLTAEQRQRFDNLSRTLALKYPNAPLTLREDWVYVGYKKLEKVQPFLTRSALQIQEQIRSISVSNKTGLL